MMNITPSNSNRSAAGQAAEAGSGAPARPVPPSGSSTSETTAGSVELSAEARAYLRLKERLASVPAQDHQAKIARLRTATGAGTYQVSGADIAAAMLRDPAVRAALGAGPRA